MTIGIAILLLWLARIVIKYIGSLEREALGTGCLTFILTLVYLSTTILMIVRFWDVPW